MIIYREAKESDLDLIAKIHQKCFPNSFSSSIGYNLLKKMYHLYLENNPTLFIVAESETIIGFVNGYRCDEPNITKEFIKKHRISLIFVIIFRLLTFDKRVYKKIFSKKNKIVNTNDEFKKIPKNNRVDLLSICVLKEFRGSGVAVKLEESFIDNVKKLNRHFVFLCAETSNERGNSFYKKIGYSSAATLDHSIVYAKKI